MYTEDEQTDGRTDGQKDRSLDGISYIYIHLRRRQGDADLEDGVRQQEQLALTRKEAQWADVAPMSDVELEKGASSPEIRQGLLAVRRRRAEADPRHLRA